MYRFKLLLGQTKESDAESLDFTVVKTKGTLSLVKREDGLYAIVGTHNGSKIFAGYGQKDKIETLFNSSNIILGFI